MSLLALVAGLTFYGTTAYIFILSVYTPLVSSGLPILTSIDPMTVVMSLDWWQRGDRLR